MGQQQLLVYILVLVIVGVATVVAINTAHQGYENANRDAVREDILLSMREAQQYYLTHTMMQGGGGSFEGITYSQLSLDNKAENGTYAVSGTSDTITIEGWGNFESVYLRATGTMQSAGRLTIEWAEGTEQEEEQVEEEEDEDETKGQGWHLGHTNKPQK